MIRPASFLAPNLCVSGSEERHLITYLCFTDEALRRNMHHVVFLVVSNVQLDSAGGFGPSLASCSSKLHEKDELITG